ncbi:unnamed protein product, partial [Ixodes hexagonus]
AVSCSRLQPRQIHKPLRRPGSLLYTTLFKKFIVTRRSLLVCGQECLSCVRKLLTQLLWDNMAQSFCC